MEHLDRPRQIERLEVLEHREHEALARACSDHPLKVDEDATVRKDRFLTLSDIDRQTPESPLRHYPSACSSLSLSGQVSAARGQRPARTTTRLARGGSPGGPPLATRSPALRRRARRGCCASSRRPALAAAR